jgi:hypothetical protein
VAASVGKQRFLRNWLFIPAVIILLASIIVRVALLVSASLSAKVGAIGVVTLFLIFAVAMITALATTDVIPWRNLKWRQLRQPRILATISSILLTSLGALYSFVPLLVEKGGPKTVRSEMEAVLAGIGKDAKAARVASETVQTGLEAKGILAGRQTLVEQMINGIWGQVGCVNTYRFTLDPAGKNARVLKVVSVRSDNGLDPYIGEFVFKSAFDQFASDGFARSTLSTEEVQGFHPGYAVDFALVKAGHSESLIWGSKNNDQNAPTLIRCEQTRGGMAR